MPADLVKLDSQKEIDSYLDRSYNLPVSISKQGPLPQTNEHYKPLFGLTKNGLNLTLRQLLHAVGSKTAALPGDYEDRCLRAAYLLLSCLDLREPHLCFRGDIESDFQTPRSQEIGVGIACLIANNHLCVPWDQLGPIPGRGKRFDYRARTQSLSIIIESKGTKYKKNQVNQISDGLDKKKAHHDAGENYNIELIVSTYIGIRNDRPRILLADPPNDRPDWIFSEQGEKYYRMRHFARVMQFIGAPNIAHLLYVDSNELRDFGTFHLARLALYNRAKMPETRIKVGKEQYVGSYFYSGIPETGSRYERLRSINRRRPTMDHSLAVFQGIRISQLEIIKSEGLFSPNFAIDHDWEGTTETDRGEKASLLSDGTIFFCSLKQRG